MYNKQMSVAFKVNFLSLAVKTGNDCKIVLRVEKTKEKNLHTSATHEPE